MQSLKGHGLNKGLLDLHAVPANTALHRITLMGAHGEVLGKNLMHIVFDTARDFVLSHSTGRRAQRGWKQLQTRTPGLTARGACVTNDNLDVVRHKRNGATAVVILDLDELSYHSAAKNGVS
eukprot:272673-Pleurochrysis_carterae.AAC.2